MKKLFQSQWHNIKFSKFHKISKSELPNSMFYKKFYELFHKKYSSFIDLDKNWINQKLKYVEIFKESKKFNKDSKILSIGCGTGLIEKKLIEEYKFNNIEITEVSDAPLKWIKKYLHPSKTHVGFFPECIQHNNKFDLIILSEIDYVFTDDEFITFVKSVNKLLNTNGECIMISSSHLKNDFVYLLKKNIQNIIAYFDNKSQFYGFSRSTVELQKIMDLAGLRFIKGDRDDEKLIGVYWSIYSKA